VTLAIYPATADRRVDFEAFFAGQPLLRSCWCMWWRLPAKDFDAGASSNRAAMGRLLDAGRIPGLLAYRDGRPAGWVSIAPRAEFGRIERSRQLGPIDAQPAWAIVCFYVPKAARGAGTADALLAAAVAHARSNGARLVEGYPVRGASPGSDPDGLFTGTESMFARAGFERVAHRGGLRSIWRKPLP
jgi:GNAT superfamily N-acetyltransferase